MKQNFKHNVSNKVETKEKYNSKNFHKVELINDKNLGIQLKNVKDIINENISDDDLLIQQYFGFSDFQTTKNKSHVDSDAHGVFMPSKLVKKYRQYINRKRKNPVMQNTNIS